MGLFATIMKFIMIILVVLLAICIVLGTILVIFPGANIFGLHYISSDYNDDECDILRTETNSTMWDEADVVRVETAGYDLVIRVKDDEVLGNGEYITVVSSSYKGFVCCSVSTLTYTSSAITGEYIIENGKKIFSIKIVEPSGLIFRAKTEMTLIVETNTFTSKDLEIISNSGAVTLGGNLASSDEQIKMQNLDINANSGVVTLWNTTISGTLDVEKDSGDVISKVDLDAYVDIDISGGYGFISLKDIGASSSSVKKLDITTTNTHTIVEDIYGDLEFIAQGGLFEIGNITGFTNLDIGSCECNLGTLSNGLNVTGADGTVNVEKVVEAVTLEMGDGTVTINETNSTVDWESQKGSLTLGKVQDDLIAQTVYGNITITCDTTVDAFNLTINNKHGATTFTGVKGIVDINTSTTIDNKGTGDITGSFAEVNGESKIVSYVGDITLTVPQTQWLLKWNNLSGTVDVSVGSLISTASNNDWVKILSDTPDDSLNKIYLVSNSGIINVRASQ